MKLNLKKVAAAALVGVLASSALTACEHATSATNATKAKKERNKCKGNNRCA